MDIVRSKLFRHDVTLLPSVGYGPGRYDQVYEEGNVDYPIGYVRWERGTATWRLFSAYSLKDRSR